MLAFPTKLLLVQTTTAKHRPQNDERLDELVCTEARNMEVLDGQKVDRYSKHLAYNSFK